MAAHGCDKVTVTEEVAAAASGRLPGMGSLLGKGEEELRTSTTRLKVCAWSRVLAAGRLCSSVRTQR